MGARLAHSAGTAGARTVDPPRHLAYRRRVRRVGVVTRALGGAERGLARLGRRPGRGIAAAGAFAFLLNAAISGLGGIPVPRVVDEFSYLLLADTFAHGRITNPTHPLWQHFETVHVIQQPTYTSKYFPGHAVLLALGQRLTGQAIVGAWLEAALAVVATGWMARAWLPARWAVWAAWGVALHPGIVAWGQRYWGGALTVAAGALVLGAFRRALDRPTATAGWAMGLGMAGLAFTRPFEGGVLCALVLAILGWQTLVARRAPLPRLAGVAPVLLLLALTFAGMAFYDWRTTGDAFVPPYVAHERVYGSAPRFIFQTATPLPAYRHPAMARYYVGYERGQYEALRSLSGYLTGRGRELRNSIAFYLPSALVAWWLPVLALPWARGGPRFGMACGLGAAFLAVCLTETVLNPHYLAPAGALLTVVVVSGWRRLRLWRPGGRRLGLVLTRAALAASALLLPATYLLDARVAAAGPHMERQRLLDSLLATGERHLVIVRDRNPPAVWTEWIANAADIDAAPVVWAREIDPSRGPELRAYFADRRAWLLDASTLPIALVPYPGS